MASFIARLVRKPPVITPATKIAISAKTTFHRASAFMVTKNKEQSLKAIFFDEVGTLFYLTETLGDHYALIGFKVEVRLGSPQLGREFDRTWRPIQPRPALSWPVM